MIKNQKELTVTREWIKEFDKQIKFRANLKTHLEKQNTKSMVRHRDSLYREVLNYKK